MKIGIVVDGMAEYLALPFLLDRIASTATIIRQPLRSGMQPYGSPAKIARDAMPAIRILAHQRKADRIVLIIDREKRQECCGEMASQIAAAILERCSELSIRAEIMVVVKDRLFENWLVADVGAVGALGKRFRLSKTAVAQIVPDKADKVEALRLLKDASQGPAFDKVQDAQRILKLAEPRRIAANSRSFRRFLRVVRDPAYRRQSKRPTEGA